MRLVRRVLVGLIVAGVGAGPAIAEEDLEQRVRELEDLVRRQGALLEAQEERIRRQEEELRRVSGERAEAAPEVAAAPPAAAPAAAEPNDFRVYWKDGIRAETRDGNVEAQIGGRIHAVAAFVGESDGFKRAADDAENVSGFRRARLYLKGRIWDRIGYKLEYDFAGGDADFKDVYAELERVPLLGTIRGGHFKEPFSLETLTSSNDLTFVERALPAALAPERNFGLMAANTVLDERMTLAAGVFRPSDDFGFTESDEAWAGTARVTGLPLWADDGRSLVHLGAAYSHRSFADDEGGFDSRPEVPLTVRALDTGDLALDTTDLVGAEAAWVHGPLSVQSEYVHSFADAPGGANPDFWGAYVYASWLLTGEHRAYKPGAGAFDRLKPRRPFLFGESSGPGAWELAARYSFLDLDDGAANGGEMDAYTLGLNWYWNPNVVILANYVYGNLRNEGAVNAFVMRFQLAL